LSDSAGNGRSLANKVMMISGGSRGIGKAIALRAARDGARVVIAAKTDRPHRVLPGTIHTAAEAVEAEPTNPLTCRDGEELGAGLELDPGVRGH